MEKPWSSAIGASFSLCVGPAMRMLDREPLVLTRSAGRRQRRVSGMARFDESLFQQLERDREVYVRVTRRDGRIGELPIWIVTVDGEAYVRSYLADRGAWYRVLADGRMTLVVRGKAVPVVV